MSTTPRRLRKFTHIESCRIQVVYTSRLTQTSTCVVLPLSSSSIAVICSAITVTISVSASITDIVPAVPALRTISSIVWDICRRTWTRVSTHRTLAFRTRSPLDILPLRSLSPFLRCASVSGYREALCIAVIATTDTRARVIVVGVGVG